MEVFQPSLFLNIGVPRVQFPYFSFLDLHGLLDDPTQAHHLNPQRVFSKRCHNRLSPLHSALTTYLYLPSSGGLKVIFVFHILQVQVQDQTLCPLTPQPCRDCFFSANALQFSSAQLSSPRVSLYFSLPLMLHFSITCRVLPVYLYSISKNRPLTAHCYPPGPSRHRDKGQGDFANTAHTLVLPTFQWLHLQYLRERLHGSGDGDNSSMRGPSDLAWLPL